MADLLDNVDKKRCKVIHSSKDYPERYKTKVPQGTRCHWCKDLILGVPLGAPCVGHANKPIGKAGGVERRFTLTLSGLFCSCPCVAAHIRHENRDATTLAQQMRDLREMRLCLFGVARDAPLPPAPRWQLLKIFGGPLSREEYRKLAGGGGEVLLEHPPILLLPQEERILLRETSKVVSSLRYMSVPPPRPSGAGEGTTIPLPSDPMAQLGGERRPGSNYKVSRRRQVLVSSSRLPPQKRDIGRRGRSSSGGKAGAARGGGLLYGGLVKKCKKQ